MTHHKILSMTGFGHAEQDLEHRKLGVEIRGVNHRYTDIRIRVPQGWNVWEQDVRNLFQETIGRGRVEVSIRWDTESATPSLPRLDPQAVQHYLNLYQELAELLQQPGKTPNVSEFFQLPGIVTSTTPDIAPERLHKTLMHTAQQAFQQFMAMRQQEGQHLTNALHEQLNTLEQHLQQIKLKIPELSKEYAKRLKDRLQQWELPQAIDPSRLEQELAIFAERSDVSEEVARTESHLSQFRDLLKQGGVIGKRLDFLCQELHREINTMSAKIQDRHLTQTLIALKSTIEKLREQVQNIE